MPEEHTQGLSAFVRVVEIGSFTAAARVLDTTPSAISKSIARLERRLVIRLFQRSTRNVSLTEEGRAYYDRIAPLLLALEEANAEIGLGQALRGKIRVTMPTDLGRVLLEPIARKLLQANPDLRLNVSLSDRRIDLIHEGFDVAIRIGALSDTELKARRIGSMRLVLAASPDYLERAGEPTTLEDLNVHMHVRYRSAGIPYGLQLADGSTFNLPAGSFDADDGQALCIGACSGLGIVQILEASIQSELAEGRLRQVLDGVKLEQVSIHAIHAYERLVPQRVKAFVDFIEAQLSALLPS